MASSAVNACGLFFYHGLFLRKCQNGIVIFNYRHLVGEDSSSHHRSAHQDLSRFLLVASAESYDIVYHSSDRCYDIFRFGHGIAVNCHPLCHQRHTRSEIFSYFCKSSDVGKYNAKISRQHACIHGLSCDLINQNSFCSLRISGLELKRFYIGYALICQ